MKNRVEVVNAAREDLKRGDLVRLCTYAEIVGVEYHDIDWCYGVYIDSVVQIHSYDGFVDAEEEYDRILCNGSVLECDNYWHIERADHQ
tara:strand:+ start:855 stop:1121 length:267 start_codon:yes stop_codon:yes gene_type:complete